MKLKIQSAENYISSRKYIETFLLVIEYYTRKIVVKTNNTIS